MIVPAKKEPKVPTIRIGPTNYQFSKNLQGKIKVRLDQQHYDLDRRSFPATAQLADHHFHNKQYDF